MGNIPLDPVHIFLVWAIFLVWTIPLVMLHITRCLGAFDNKVPADYLAIERLLIQRNNVYLVVNGKYLTNNDQITLLCLVVI